MRFFIPILLIVSLPLPGFGSDSGQVKRTGSYIDVTIEYGCMFPGYLQIKDEECKFTTCLDCERARIRLQREDCRRESPHPGCREAEEMLATSFCIPGLIYEGVASRGDAVTVSICKSTGGFGNISIRNLRNGETWTRYFLLTDGNTVKYH